MQVLQFWLFFIVMAATAPLLAPYGFSDFSSQPLLSPDNAHPLGTDDVGRDIFTELLYGSRTSLTVASVVSLGVLVIGTSEGYSQDMWVGPLTGS